MDKVLAAWHVVIAFVVAHPKLVGVFVGLYILVATGINRRLEKPTTWYGKLAHFIFLDWAALLAAKNAEMHGFVLRLGKYEIGVPFVSWSQALEEAESAIIETLTKVGVLLLCALSFSACDKFYIASAASITTADKAVQAADDLLPDAEAAKLAEITATAHSLAEDQQRTAVLKKKGDLAESSIITTHKSLRLAADLVDGARKGLVVKADAVKRFAAAIRAYYDLRDLLNDFDIELPGGI